MRHRVLWLAVGLCFTASCAPSQRSAAPERSADERAVLATVERLFDAMAKRDSAAARKVLDPRSDFVVVQTNATGRTLVQRAPNSGFLANLATGTVAYLERMWDAEVRVHGPLATVWTPYEFYLDGKFSHCGIDAIQLVRGDSGWTIVGGSYTVERTGCAPSPLGALK